MNKTKFGITLIAAICVVILISGCSQKLSRTPTADEDQIPTVVFQKERGGIHIPSTLYLLTFKSSQEKKETVILLQIGKSTFTVNGVSNTLDSPPVIKNGRTLVPIRAIIEALGGTIGWDAAEKKVTISFGSTTIELWIGKSTAKVNGINTPIDPTNLQVVPEIINGRTMLPLRFVAESLGCSVDWNATTKTITIKYPKEEQMTGDYTDSTVWDGLERTYLLHVPSSYDKNKSMPLVIALHGGGGTAEGMMKTITLGGFNTLADKEGFIVVYPNGVEGHWNDYRNDMLAKDVENVDDVGFISALIDHLVKTLNVDPNRVYVTGMSNGAMMTHRLALELTDKIAAVATVAGNIPEDQLKAGIPKRAIPVLIISGTDDPIMPWNGGYVLREPKRGKVISVPETVKYWVNNNKCSSKPEISYEPDLDPDDGTRVRKEVYGNGANGTEVILYAVEGGGHTWPGGSSELPESVVGKISRDINANEIIWNFFKKYSRK
jgi:polyhydroxybutyrate depolymerase